MTETLWTEARVTALRQLIAEKVPFSQIAKRLGVSRNAAIGKANRLKIAAHTEPAQSMQAPSGRTGHGAAIGTRQRLPEPWDRRLRPPLRLRCEPIPPAAVADPLNLPMDQLKWFHCRYITNDDLSAPTYCARRTVESTSWCAFHLSRVRAPPPVDAGVTLCPASDAVTITA